MSGIPRPPVHWKIASTMVTIMGAQAPDRPSSIIRFSPGNVRLQVQGGRRLRDTPKIHLAMESGEVHGTIANWSTLKAINANWITEKKFASSPSGRSPEESRATKLPMILDVARTDAER